MEHNAIELVHLNKRYGERDVVFSDVNLTLPLGQVIGLVGENGAGKTTFIKLISGMAKQDSGDIYVLGQPLRDEASTLRLRNDISILGDANRALYWNMSGMDNIAYFWTLKTGKSPAQMPPLVAEYLERFRMNSFIHKKVEVYSKGMKQRLLLLLCLLSEPKILFMDEPLNGLDFENAFILKQIISEFAVKHNGTVIITSHDRHFINEVCDSQYVIRDKTITKCDTFNPLNKEIVLYVRFHADADRQIYIDAFQGAPNPASEDIYKITAPLNDERFYRVLAEDLEAGRLQILEVRQ